MPTTTIPVTLNISVTLPEGAALATPLAAGQLSQQESWQFTSAVAVCDPPPAANGFHNRIADALPEFAAEAPVDPQLAELRATIARQQSEVTQLRAALAEARELLAQAVHELTEARVAVLEEMEQSAGEEATTASDKTKGTADGERGAPPPEDRDDPVGDQFEATCDYTLDGQLVPPNQRLVAALLAGGTSNTNAGRAVGVTRKTVHAWKRNSPAFLALYNSYCNEIRETAEARMQALAHQSIDVLASHLDAKSSRVAVQLARGLGLLTGKPKSLACERADLLGVPGITLSEELSQEEVSCAETPTVESPDQAFACAAAA